MTEFVDVDESFTLEDYETLAPLMGPVRELRSDARIVAPRLRDRTVWMVNSTVQGGGVAEMLPKMVSLLNELGIRTRWGVIQTDEPEFFALTKALHNLIHGSGDPAALTDERRAVYDEVSRVNADSMKGHIGPDDVLIVHDPQPMGMGRILKQELGLTTLWRCHIGLDHHGPQTRAAWNFLRRYADDYDGAIFSAAEYIPDYFAGRSSVICPAIDPCGHKNRELSPHKLVGILCNAGLKHESQPVVTPPFEHQAMRLRDDGTFTTAMDDEQIGLLYRPIISQISRWDRLKGWSPLLEGFVRLKRRIDDGDALAPRHRRRLETVRLVMAGPDPASIADDPEGREVLDDLCAAYTRLPDRIRDDVVLLTLPMDSRKQNALMVNALQRCSTIAVQNSIQEGFGLTVTEAMWKRVPVMGTHACGIRQQVRDGVDGVLLRDPTDPGAIARELDTLLENVMQRDLMARSGQRRVFEKFLVYSQLCDLLRLIASLLPGSRS